MDSVYILELENSKYFLLNTTSRSRIPDDYLCVYLPDSYSLDEVVRFFEKYDNEWLKLYRPLSVISKLPGDDSELHSQLLECMRKKGIENVRGGIADSVVLNTQLVDFLSFVVSG